MSMLEGFDLSGKTALVTGGTKGIGRAIALALAQAGADVAVVSRNPDPELAAEIKNSGRRFLQHAADLTQREAVKAVVPAVRRTMGDVDILVNNAGICLRAPILEFSEGDWDSTIEIDLSAAFILTQAVGAVMIERGWGKVVNIASVLAFQGGLNIPAYAASKHGIVGLTKSFANEWAQCGICVNAIAPGYISTELTTDLEQDPERCEAIVARIPAGRWGAAKDVAGMALFLASPASDYVNGAVFPVDGGWLGR